MPNTPNTLKQPQVKTVKPAKRNAHRLPHERDESDDSQTSAPREDMKQAYRDATSGQVDTDLRREPGADEIIKRERGKH